MKCRIELQKLQSAVVEIEVSDDAKHEELYQTALKHVTEWKDIGNPDIEFFEELPSL